MLLIKSFTKVDFLRNGINYFMIYFAGLDNLVARQPNGKLTASDTIKASSGEQTKPNDKSNTELTPSINLEASMTTSKILIQAATETPITVVENGTGKIKAAGMKCV